MADPEPPPHCGWATSKNKDWTNIGGNWAKFPHWGSLTSKFSPARIFGGNTQNPHQAGGVPFQRVLGPAGLSKSPHPTPTVGEGMCSPYIISTMSCRNIRTMIMVGTILLRNTSTKFLDPPSPLRKSHLVFPDLEQEIFQNRLKAQKISC